MTNAIINEITVVSYGNSNYSDEDNLNTRKIGDEFKVFETDSNGFDQPKSNLLDIIINPVEEENKSFHFFFELLISLAITAVFLAILTAISFVNDDFLNTNFYLYICTVYVGRTMFLHAKSSLYITLTSSLTQLSSVILISTISQLSSIDPQILFDRRSILAFIGSMFGFFILIGSFVITHVTSKSVGKIQDN